MAKFTHLGSAGPDDPIYQGGLQIFNPIPRPAPKPPKEQPEEPTTQQEDDHDDHA